MKPQTILLFILLWSAMNACRKPEEPPLNPALTSFTNLECVGRSEVKGNEPTSEYECVDWFFDGKCTLTLKHYNAGFNCCPESILVTLDVRGDTLLISEDDAKELCRCNCLYDIDLTITQLERKKWVVRILEPQVTVNEGVMEFELDLEAGSSGRYCLYRDHNPWTGEPDVIRLMKEDHWEFISMDMFTIDTVFVDGDSLRIDVSYSGGCRKHQFILWKLPDANPRGIPEVLLEHRANDDMCEAWISQKLAYSLVPLRQEGTGEVTFLMRGTPLMSAYWGQYTYRY